MVEYKETNPIFLQIGFIMYFTVNCGLILGLLGNFGK